MVRIEHARDGSRIAAAGGIYLNSRYDPRQEAARFVERNFVGEIPRTVLILGETLGYLSGAIQEKFPHSRCITVFYDSTLRESASPSGCESWHPGAVNSLSDFLSSILNEFDLQSFALVEWEPSARVYPEIAESSRVAVRRIVSLYNGNIGTTALFGRLWIRNTVRNFLSVGSVATLVDSPNPLVIAASGPTLADSLDILATNRQRFRLWALPSSIPALRNRGLKPDLLILTDPGFYSTLHLRPLLEEPLPVAMPYTATKDGWRVSSKTVLLNQGSFLENTFIAGIGVPHVKIEPNGTVAGTALLLALGHPGPLVFAGLDFSERDLLSHVRPHSFDSYLEAQTTRFNPRHTTQFERVHGNSLRSESTTSVGPLNTYSHWFNMHAKVTGRVLHRLNPSSVDIEGMSPLDNKAFATLCGKFNAQPGEGCGDGPRTPGLDEKKRFLRFALSDLSRKIELGRQNGTAALPGPHVFLGDSPWSLVYQIATANLMKFLKSGNRSLFSDACGEAVEFLHELSRYAL